jgi:hypothetical protein
MKNTIVKSIVVAALLISGAALAAGETGNKAQPTATQPAAASAVPPATAAESIQPAPAKEPQPTLKRSTSSKHAKAKPSRSKSLDLRHCLELTSNAAIANCAGE